jgi:predicted Zn-dependent protease
MSTFAAAWYFDGRNAAATPVGLVVQAGQLQVLGADGTVHERRLIAQLSRPERFAGAPLMLHLPGGGALQIDRREDIEGIEDVLGARRTIVERLQTSWPIAMAAVVILVGMMTVAYLRGVPMLADAIAESMPPRAEQHIGNEVLKILDKRFLAKSDAYTDRKEAIARRFAAMVEHSAPGVPYQLEFRRTKEGNGINAFALPGGVIVVLDGLIDASATDEQVLAVLGHELGHVALRHPIRRVASVVGVGVLAGLLWGDVSSVAAQVPTVLGVLRYSREYEREADDFAARVLTEAGFGTAPLVEFFQILNDKAGGNRQPLPGFLSTHPATPERIQRLRAQ